MGGKYYAILDLAIPDNKMILNIYIQDWSTLKESDVIQIGFDGSRKISVMCNTNTFSAGAAIRLAIVYIK